MGSKKRTRDAVVVPAAASGLQQGECGSSSLVVSTMGKRLNLSVTMTVPATSQPEDESLTPGLSALLGGNYAYYPGTQMPVEGWFQGCRGCRRRTAHCIRNRAQDEVPACRNCAEQAFREHPDVCALNLPSTNATSRSLSDIQRIAMTVMTAHSQRHQESQAALEVTQSTSNHDIDHHTVHQPTSHVVPATISPPLSLQGYSVLPPCSHTNPLAQQGYACLSLQGPPQSAAQCYPQHLAQSHSQPFHASAQLPASQGFCIQPATSQGYNPYPQHRQSDSQGVAISSGQITAYAPMQPASQPTYHLPASSHLHSQATVLHTHQVPLPAPASIQNHCLPHTAMATSVVVFTSAAVSKVHPGTVQGCMGMSKGYSQEDLPLGTLRANSTTSSTSSTVMVYPPSAYAAKQHPDMMMY